MRFKDFWLGPLQCKYIKKDTVADNNAHRKTMFVPTDIQTHTSGSCLSASYQDPRANTVNCGWVCVVKKTHMCMYQCMCLEQIKQSLRLSWGDFCVLSMRRHMLCSDLILLRVPVPQTERNGLRAGWMRDERCYMLLKGASVLQHLCGRGVCAWAYVHSCPCLCVCLHSYMSGRKRLPHRNVCSHCLQLLVGVCNTHMEEQRGKRGQKETGELQATSQLKIMKKSRHPRGCVRLCPFATGWGSLLTLAPRGSKHFLPDGCETLLRPSNASW